uniref:Gag1-like clamp domain-containing protein n=1 Tax=Leersia perrieri TaxID=77586 RepID=A0A0D9UXC8_9ORYZ
MAAARGGGEGGEGGSASRVGDWGVDLGEGWDWRSIPKLLSSACLFICSGGCFGCCDSAVRHLGQLSKSLIPPDQNYIGEELWSTTTIEVEQPWALDQHGGGTSHGPPEYVNHGLVLWKEIRKDWTANRRPIPEIKQIREPILSWNAAYESLLGSNKPFHQPIPLHEMVDFLVDIWEQEGLYD